MARTQLTLGQIRSCAPPRDQAEMAATTEADIRRHQIDDGRDPDAPLPPFRAVPNVPAIRSRLHMAQQAFAAAIAVLQAA